MKKMLAVILAMMFLLSACGTTGTTNTLDSSATGDAGTSDTSASESGDTESTATQVAKVNLGSEPPSLNSMMTYDVISFDVLKAVEEGLTKLDDNNEVVPGIAESWDVSDDGLTYTFHLRDATWSNGDPVTANDFVFAWENILSPDSGAPYGYLLYAIKGAQAYNSGEASLDEVGIEATDDQTLVVTLEQAIPYFDFLCAQVTFLPVNEAYYEEVTADGGTYASDADKMLYDGPFTMDTWTHESEIVLKKNTSYYDSDTVKLDGIEMSMVAEGTTAYNMFTTGQLDEISLDTGNLIEQAEADGETVLTKSDGATEYLEFNLDDEFLSNVNIRRALSYAINRASLVENALKDGSTAALSFTNPDISSVDGGSFKDKVGDVVKDNDATAAKEAWEKGLEELGLTEAPALTFTIDDTDSAKMIGAVLQEFWKQNLGIDVEIESMPYKSKLAAVSSGDYQMAISAWGPDYNDAMTFLEMFVTGSGMTETNYSSEDYDSLISQAKAELDEEKREELMVQAEQLMLEDAPITPLYFMNDSYIVSDRLKNLYRSSFQDLDLNMAYIEEE